MVFLPCFEINFIEQIYFLSFHRSVAQKNFIIKLKSYQLAINNRTDSETVLLVNQALKDLSHSYWGISLVAFQFLFYSDDEDLVTSNVFFLLQNESTQRAALNSLHYFPESWLRYESKILSLIKDTGSLTSCLQVLDLRASSSPAQPFKQEIIGLIQKQLNSSMDIFLLNLIHFADASEGQLRTQLIELLEPMVNDLEPSVYFRSLLLMPDKLEESIFLKKLEELSFDNRITREQAAQNISEILNNHTLDCMLDIVRFLREYPSSLNTVLCHYGETIAKEYSDINVEIFEYLQFSNSLDVHVQIQLSILLYLSSKANSNFKENELLNEIVEFIIDQNLLSIITTQKHLLPNLYLYITMNNNDNSQSSDAIYNACIDLVSSDNSK